MLKDHFFPALIRAPRLALGIATTTRLCQHAQQAHSLQTTSAIALGRLMTAAALTGLLRQQSGTVSLQVLCEGRLHHLYADITPEGYGRGYVKNATMAMPALLGETVTGRRSIAAAIGKGHLSVIRMPEDRDFTQSMTPLVSGELDADVEHFLIASDQIPTALVCDVLLDEEGKISRAGGVIVQALPGADLARLEAIKKSLAGEGFAALLADHAREPGDLLHEIDPTGEMTDEGLALHWRCRCSFERVLASLRLFGAVYLAEMLSEGEPVHVTCDFCGQVYDVSPEKVGEVYRSLVQQVD